MSIASYMTCFNFGRASNSNDRWVVAEINSNKPSLKPFDGKEFQLIKATEGFCGRILRFVSCVPLLNRLDYVVKGMKEVEERERKENIAAHLSLVGKINMKFSDSARNIFKEYFGELSTTKETGKPLTSRRINQIDAAIKKSESLDILENIYDGGISEMETVELMTQTTRALSNISKALFGENWTHSYPSPPGSSHSDDISS